MCTTPPIWIGLAFIATAVACGGQAPPPPVLTVTSPARGLMQSGAGQITVTGTAMPSASGDPVAKVTVNGVAAALQPSGAFRAMIDAPKGAMLLETVAVTDKGGSMTDTRAVQSGQLRKVGAGIDRAITAALSADAFTRLSAVAGPLLKTMDLATMLAPMQPMTVAGDDLANLSLSVTALSFRDTRIALAPVDGGLSFRATFDGLDVAATVAYGGALVPDGSTDVAIHADQVTITGTLDIAPAGTAGFATQLVNPAVHTVGLNLSASGLAGQILDLLNGELGSTIKSVAAQSAELAMGPLVNLALGALAGPKQIDLFGKKLDMQVSPSMIDFTPDGGVVEMNMKAMLEGSEQSPGFIYTDNGAPSLDRVYGLQIGLADDLANEMLAEMHALGMLNLTMPQNAGVFDTAQIQLTMPPMISADATDGEMRVVLGDMLATFTSHGTPVGKAAINAKVELKIAPVAGGGAVALQLGKPEIHVNTLDDVANTTGLADKDLAAATGAVLGAQIDAITKLLVAIPIPSIAGLQFHDLSISADDGYVMVSGQLQ
jgi:hypothetical protein